MRGFGGPMRGPGMGNPGAVRGPGPIKAPGPMMGAQPPSPDSNQAPPEAMGQSQGGEQATEQTSEPPAQEKR